MIFCINGGKAWPLYSVPLVKFLIILIVLVKVVVHLEVVVWSAVKLLAQDVLLAMASKRGNV